jgi:dolichol kinase
MTYSRDQLAALIEELYALIHQLDAVPAGGAPAALLEVDMRLDHILEQIQRFRAEAGQLADGVRLSLDRLAASARAAKLNARADLNERLERMRELRTRLADSYEGLLATAKADPRWRDLSTRWRSLRPRNYTRNIFHMANALLGVALYQWVIDRGTCILLVSCMLGTWILIDITRRLSPRVSNVLYDRLLSAITRPRERYTVPAATWYTVGLLIVITVTDQTTAQLAVLVLGFGDPWASIVGRRWGTRKLFRRKSWAGTAAFITASFIACLGFMLVAKNLAWGPMLLMAVVAALAGATAELLSDDKLDDNLTIPVTAALALMGLSALL